eukprot:TRINITY_DN27318_c0_g1_i1.p1 TRINITY_DN27318_c0_g1~~TRINITY_DN27318_c0_g1_i1.p1  ORF type:complete len:422 (+),score=70.24 TRINITY_DN27318_c0_g1_i1:79-1344(+)
MSVFTAWLLFSIQSIAVSSLETDGDTRDNSSRVNVTNRTTEFCPDFGATFASQMPFYLQALTTASTVLVNHVAFPEAAQSSPGGNIDIGLAALATLSSVNTSLHDIIRGLASYLESVIVCAFLAGIFYFSGIYIVIALIERMTKCLDDFQFIDLKQSIKTEDCAECICRKVLAPCINFVCWAFCQLSAYFLAIFVAFVIASLVTFAVLFCMAAITAGSEDVRWVYNCSTLRWTSGSTQLPNIVVAFVLSTKRNIMHRRRVWMAMPFAFASIAYSPPLALAMISHVLLGLVVYPHLTLLLMAFVFCLFRSGAKAHAKATTDHEDCSSKALLLAPLQQDMVNTLEAVEGQEAQGAAFQLAFKLMLVPLVLYIQFVGEATARFYAGEGWWGSQRNTFMERSTARYIEHLESGAMNVVSLLLSFF